MRTACGNAGTGPNDVRNAHALALTDTVGPFAWSQVAGTAGGAAYPGASSAYDPTRNRTWFTNAANANNSKIEWFDHGTGAYGSTNYTGSARSLVTGAVDLGCLRYEATHDALIFTAGNTSSAVVIEYMLCTNPAAGWTQPSLSASITGHASGTSFPMDYVTATGKWYGISRGDLTHVYEITIPATITDQWTVSAVAFGATLPTFYVPGKAWCYFPVAKSFVFVSAHNVVYAYRPVGV